MPNIEIKRKTTIQVERHRRVVAAPAPPASVAACARCGGSELMLTAEHAAARLGISRRLIYRLVEAGAAHFVETEAGEVMLCLGSLTASLKREPGE